MFFDVFRYHNFLVLYVILAVFISFPEVVAVIHHHPARGAYPASGRIGHPVDSPHFRPVSQMKIGYKRKLSNTITTSKVHILPTLHNAYPLFFSKYKYQTHISRKNGSKNSTKSGTCNHELLCICNRNSLKTSSVSNNSFNRSTSRSENTRSSILGLLSACLNLSNNHVLNFGIGDNVENLSNLGNSFTSSFATRLIM